MGEALLPLVEAFSASIVPRKAFDEMEKGTTHFWRGNDKDESTKRSAKPTLSRTRRQLGVSQPRTNAARIVRALFFWEYAMLLRIAK